MTMIDNRLARYDVIDTHTGKRMTILGYKHRASATADANHRNAEYGRHRYTVQKRDMEEHYNKAEAARTARLVRENERAIREQLAAMLRDLENTAKDARHSLAVKVSRKRVADRVRVLIEESNARIFA